MKSGNPWVKSGNPWVAKTCRNFSIVAVALVLDGTRIYFNPLAICINHYKKKLFPTWPCMVYV